MVLRATLMGLVAKPELNGSDVIVDEFLPDKNRFRVFHGSNNLSIKVANLMFHSTPPGVCGVGELNLGEQFDSTLRELLAQGNGFHETLHGVLNITVVDETNEAACGRGVKDFEAMCPHSLPGMPPGETFAGMYPLGGCKLVATIVGILASPFTQGAKFAQRKFSSQTMQIDFGKPRTPNANEDVLRREFEAAKKTIALLPGAGVNLTVSLTDVHAQENPHLAPIGGRHEGHFAHVFNMVITNGREAETVETRVYSAFKGKDINFWLREKNAARSLLADPEAFLTDLNEIEKAGTWSSKTQATYRKLFDVDLPALTKKRWPVKTHVRILRSTFDAEDLRRSAGLFDRKNWCAGSPFGLFGA